MPRSALWRSFHRPPASVNEGFVVANLGTITNYNRLLGAGLGSSKWLKYSLNDGACPAKLCGQLIANDELGVAYEDDLLNPSQQAAVAMALRGGAVTLVQGPPGTGKTTTTSALLEQIVLVQGQRAQVCAPSNAATEQVLVSVLAKTRIDAAFVIMVSHHEDYAGPPDVLLSARTLLVQQHIHQAVMCGYAIIVSRC